MKVLPIAISLLSGSSLVYGQCVLDGLIIKGSCSLDSINIASTACTPDVVLGMIGGEEVLEMACKDAYQLADVNMLPWSAVTKRGYQFDKEFFNGGTIFNTEMSVTNFERDTQRLAQIRAELLNKHGIGWPSNIDNFDLNQSCENHAAMCCYVDSRSPNNPLGDNTDVCHHYMGDSPRSAHVEGGESVFSGSSDEGEVYCHGFYWDNDDRYKGNLLFEVAMSKGLLDNGYVRNIPGAPMCGCIEQMPVVTNAACTSMTVTEDFELSFTTVTDSSQLSIRVVGDPDIQFKPCGGDGSLNGGYTNDMALGDISKYVTGKDSCTEEEAYALDALAFRKRDADDQWIPVAGKGYLYSPSLSMSEFNTLFAQSPNQIVRRRCFECDATHKDIYYRRYDTNGLPPNLDLLHILKNYWHDIDGNKFHTDFELYSTYEDALTNTNPWLACNFNDRNVGFPRDCGPLNRVHNQWNAFEPVDGRHHGRYHVGFYVEGASNRQGENRHDD